MDHTTLWHVQLIYNISPFSFAFLHLKHQFHYVTLYYLELIQSKDNLPRIKNTFVKSTGILLWDFFSYGYLELARFVLYIFIKISVEFSLYYQYQVINSTISHPTLINMMLFPPSRTISIHSSHQYPIVFYIHSIKTRNNNFHYKS